MGRRSLMKLKDLLEQETTADKDMKELLSLLRLTS